MSQDGCNPHPPDRDRIGILIPVRLESRRFAGKALKAVWGQPLLWWAYRAAVACKAAGLVRVVTDSPEVGVWCREHDVDCYHCALECPTGSDRLAMALGRPESGLGHLDLIIDLQADEPQITAEDLSRLIRYMHDHRTVVVATYGAVLDQGSMTDPNAVKVLLDRHNHALYFTRAAVTFTPCRVFHHIGVYAYRRRILEAYGRYPRGQLEQAESLEQLRFLEEGIPVDVLTIGRQIRGVNTARDLEWLEQQESPAGTSAN